MLFSIQSNEKKIGEKDMSDPHIHLLNDKNLWTWHFFANIRWKLHGSYMLLYADKVCKKYNMASHVITGTNQMYSSILVGWWSDCF